MLVLPRSRDKISRPVIHLLLNDNILNKKESVETFGYSPEMCVMSWKKETLNKSEVDNYCQAALSLSQFPMLDISSEQLSHL